MKKTLIAFTIVCLSYLITSQTIFAQTPAPNDCNADVQEVYFNRTTRMCYVQTANVNNTGIGCYVRNDISDPGRGCLFVKSISSGPNIYHEFNCDVVGYSDLMQFAGLNFDKCRLNNGDLNVSNNFDWNKAKYWGYIVDAQVKLQTLPQDVISQMTNPPLRTPRYTVRKTGDDATVFVSDLIDFLVGKKTPARPKPAASDNSNSTTTTQTSSNPVSITALDKINQMLDGIKNNCNGRVTAANKSCLSTIQPPVNTDAQTTMGLSCKVDSQHPNLQCVGLVMAAYEQGFDKSLKSAGNANMWASAKISGYTWVPINNTNGKQIKPHDLVVWRSTHLIGGSENYSGHIGYVIEVNKDTTTGQVLAFTYAEADGYTGKVSKVTSDFSIAKHIGDFAGWQSFDGITSDIVPPNGGGTGASGVVRYWQGYPTNNIQGYGNLIINTNHDVYNYGCGHMAVASIVASLKDKGYTPLQEIAEYNQLPDKAGYIMGWQNAKDILETHGFEVGTDIFPYGSSISLANAAPQFKQYLDNGWDGIFVLADFSSGPNHYYWIPKVDSNNTIWGVDSAYKYAEGPPINENNNFSHTYIGAFAFRIKK